MKLYIESSVFNFIFADDAPDKQKITKEFFTNKLMNFDAFVSDIVYNELGKTKEPKRSVILNLISDYPFKTLSTDKETLKLAKIYVKEKIMKIRPEPIGRANSGRSEAESRVVGFSGCQK